MTIFISILIVLMAVCIFFLGFSMGALHILNKDVKELLLKWRNTVNEWQKTIDAWKADRELWEIKVQELKQKIAHYETNHTENKS